MTTHDFQTQRYSQPWTDPDARVSGATAAPDLAVTEDSLSKFQARIDALREQVNFAVNALRLSEAELDAISASLAGH